jgi:hypothetical protein
LIEGFCLNLFRFHDGCAVHVTRDEQRQARRRATSAPNVSHRMSSAPQRAPPRRNSSIHPNTINKGATARSAVNPRVSASLNSPRRSSFKSTTPPPDAPDASDALAASLKRETEEKERVCDRVPSLLPARRSYIPSSSFNCRTRTRPSKP